jgi:uncharacterized protein YdeI (YjbR/CyaY-like superfamily)
MARIDESMDVLFFENPAELRAWFEANHASTGELWIGLYKKGTGRPTITYYEALDQALCFGWIDGLKKRIDEVSFKQRFTPRKAKSNWSEINIKRVGELTELGLMAPAGLKAFNARDPEKTQQYSYEARNRPLDDVYLEQFKANPAAWAAFETMPPSYQKAANWWVMSAKTEATRMKRLAALIDDSAQGRRVPPLRRNA